MTNYSLKQQVSFQRVGDDAVLLHTESGDYYGLNTTGAFIVEQLMVHGDSYRAIESICTQYEVSNAQAQADFDQLMTVLLSKGLVETATA